ncbi:MAG: ParM/StbA family protein [Nitrospiraceae bacterium]|nr:ParM/StbA family protein [Nitrospiraceae bacterium]
MSEKFLSATADNSEPETIDVGIDDGYAAVKVAWYDQIGAIRTLSIPSSARQGSYGIGSFDSAGAVGGYETDGLRFTVDPGVFGDTTRFSDYNLSPLARVLAHHALISAGLAGKPLRIGSGLPLNRYFRDEKKNMGRISRKIESFASPVRRLDGGESVRIVRHEVFAQGLAAVIDWLSDGISIETQVGPVGVVDIGGQTTDISVILPPLRADHRHLATCETGVLDVRALLKRRIQSLHDLDEIQDSLLDRALKTGKIRLHGNDEDVQKERDDAIREIESRLANQIRSVFEETLPSLDAVLFVGGGTLVFRGLSQTFPNAIIPENPEFANARGILKALSLSGGKS